MHKRYFILIMLIALLSGCHDDTDEMLNINFNESETIVERYEGYNSVTCVLPESEHFSKIFLSCSSGWLKLTSDTLPEDGIIEFYVCENTDVKRREAIIEMSVSGNSQSATLAIKQKGLGDYADNANDDKLDDFCIGWGYDAYLDYKSSKSARKKVIDTEKLKRWDSDTTFVSVQEVARASEDFETQTAYSLLEMAQKLTQTQSKTKKFLGVRKTTKRYSSVCTNSLSEQYCGYARLQKVVAQRSIDAGALLHVINYCKSDEMPFTTEFYSLYRDICNAPNNSKAINKMLDDYGTHVVINACMGGSLDFVVTFNRHETNDIKEVIEEKCKNVFGRKSYSYSGSKTIEATSDIKNENSFEIRGGSSETVETLQSTISNMTKTSQLSMQDVNNWLASIKYSNINDSERRHSLDIVDFDFIPIWELFTDPTVQSAIQNVVIDRGNRSTNEIPSSVLGADNYSIELPDMNLSEWPSFGFSKVNAIFYHDAPIIEVCEEYVPKIRTDRPVFVFYPIYDGRSRISQGIFPGDGEGNRPAYLTFSGSDCYVNPIDGYGYYDRIKTLYYLHGNLYADNYGLKTTQILTNYGGSYGDYDDDYYMFTPIHFMGLCVVKIGSGYWTQEHQAISNIPIAGIYPWDSATSFSRISKIVDNRLYANIFSNNTEFAEKYKKVYGNDVNEIFKEREKWYLPLTSDVENMIKYLGGNVKSLFLYQQTGFDAEFNGFIGNYSIEDGEETSIMKENCFIVTKNSLISEDGKLFMITPNYDYKVYNTSKDDGNEYPVRLFRTNYFKYTYENIRY